MIIISCYVKSVKIITVRMIEKRKNDSKSNIAFVAVAKNIALEVFKISLSYLSLFFMMVYFPCDIETVYIFLYNLVEFFLSLPLILTMSLTMEAGFNPRPFHVRFFINEVELGNMLLRVQRLFQNRYFFI
jgi:hypothetical protein